MVNIPGLRIPQRQEPGGWAKYASGQARFAVQPPPTRAMLRAAQPWGCYAVLGKFPANYKIPAHWHPAIEHVTVISGTLNLGLGDKLDEAKAKPLSAGSVAIMQPKTNHFGWTKDETVVQVHGVGPWGVTYVNPADDPRKEITAVEHPHAARGGRRFTRRHTVLSAAADAARSADLHDGGPDYQRTGRSPGEKRRWQLVASRRSPLYGECMARLISTTVRLEEEDVRALQRARAAGHSASALIRKGLRVVASRYYTGRRPPSTRLFESTDNKLGDESELFRDLEA